MLRPGQCKIYNIATGIVTTKLQNCQRWQGHVNLLKIFYAPLRSDKIFWQNLALVGV